MPRHIAVSQELSTLWKACVRSIPKFILPDTKILARRAVWDGARFKAVEPSPRNTAEILKSLYRIRSHGCVLPIEPQPLLEHLVRGYLHDLEYMDLALLIWADSVGDCLFIPELWRTLQERWPSQATETMELSWTLSALCYLFGTDQKPKSLENFAHQLYERIARNQSQRTGFFHEFSRPLEWLWRRDRSSSLSSQAYAIQALALYGQTFAARSALERARRCADAICGLQGPSGQWWWSYDAAKGKTAQRYPLYSVNQDAAIPMALGVLQRALHEDRYSPHVMKGISWLFGENEIRTPLVNEDLGVIWRCVEQDDNGGFVIRREMFSYHSARCLFWLCDESPLPSFSDQENGQ